MENHVRIGKIVRPFGIKGEVKVALNTDFPLERFKRGQLLQIQGPLKSFELTVASFRLHQDHGLCLFKEIDTLDLAETLRDHTIWIDHQIILDHHELTFYHLKGCQVMMNQQPLGEVVEVLDMPAHPVLRVKGLSKSVLVPYVDVFLEKVDRENKIIYFKEIIGL